MNGRWGWIAEGLFTSEEEIMDHAKQFGEGHPGQISKVGDIKYKDLNGDGVIDDYDKCLIGQGDVPKIYYGFGADLQLGDFSVGALFAGNAKADRCLGGNAMYPLMMVQVLRTCLQTLLTDGLLTIRLIRMYSILVCIMETMRIKII